MSKYTKVIAALGVAAGLGVASLPFGAFAVTTGDVTVTTTVPDILELSFNDGGDSVELTESGKDAGTITAGGYGVADDATVVSVQTNKPHGYSLTVSGEPLVNGTDDTEIPNLTTAADITSGDTAEGWGIRVAVAEGQTLVEDGAFTDLTASTYLMPTDETEIDNVASVSSETTKEYTISYGAKVKNGATAGTYTGTCTFTATANPGA